MGANGDRLLSNAGVMLIAAGALAAFAGGSYGLVEQRPGLVILCVLLLMGYGVVGYLLMNRGARDYHVVMPATAVLVVSTILLFQAGMQTVLGDGFLQYVLKPALVLLLAFAAGAMLTHTVEEMTPRVAWPARGARSLNTLLHVAAYPPVFGAFTLLDLMRSPSTWASILIVGASAAIAIACVVGGYAAARGSHPAFTLAGGALGFLGSAAYLFQFMSSGRVTGEAAFGELNALIGLIVSSLPIAIATVAWIQVNAGETEVDPAASP